MGNMNIENLKFVFYGIGLDRSIHEFFGTYYVYWIKFNPSIYALMKSKRNFDRSYQTCYGYNENCTIAKFLILNRQIQIRKNTKVMDRVIR